MDFWYLRISRSATVPGLYLCGFFTPPADAPRGLRRQRTPCAAQARCTIEITFIDGDALQLRTAYKMPRISVCFHRM